MASPFEVNTCHSRDQAKWDEIHQENTRPALPSLEPPSAPLHPRDATVCDQRSGFVCFAIQPSPGMNLATTGALWGPAGLALRRGPLGGL